MILKKLIIKSNGNISNLRSLILKGLAKTSLRILLNESRLYAFEPNWGLEMNKLGR